MCVCVQPLIFLLWQNFWGVKQPLLGLQNTQSRVISNLEISGGTLEHLNIDKQNWCHVEALWGSREEWSGGIWGQQCQVMCQLALAIQLARAVRNGALSVMGIWQRAEWWALGQQRSSAGIRWCPSSQYVSAQELSGSGQAAGVLGGDAEWSFWLSLECCQDGEKVADQTNCLSHSSSARPSGVRAVQKTCEHTTPWQELIVRSP